MILLSLYTYMMVDLTTLYLITTALLFAYTVTEQLSKGSGYFPAILTYLTDQNCVFILYNAVLSLAIVGYKIFVFCFFGNTTEGEVIKITDKLKMKIIDIVFFSYLIELQFGFQVYLVLVLLIFLFVLHSHLVFRAQYLVHVHTTSASLFKHYQAMALFLILFFFDYQILKAVGKNFLSLADQSQALFLYYMFSTATLLLEPFLQFAVDFYEKYTFTHFNNSDQFLATAGLLINLPRLIIQLLISLWISYKFSQPFFFIICCIDNVGQIKKTIQSFGRIKRLTRTMSLLKKVKGQQLEAFHDLTCTVCYQEIKQGVMLPCRHIFHQECIRQWIIKNHNHFCPKCKQPFDFQKLENQYQPQPQPRPQPVQQFRNIIPQPNRQYGRPQRRPYLPQQQTQDRYYQPQNQQRTFRRGRQNILVKDQDNPSGIARQYIIDRPDLSEYPLQIYQSLKKGVVAVGGLPYGLPVSAVQKRTQQHMTKRQEYQKQLQVVLKLMKMSRNQQLLFL